MEELGQLPTARLDSTFMNERPLCAMSGHCKKLIRETAVSYLRRISAID
jgi:hypothetical protein